MSYPQVPVFSSRAIDRVLHGYPWVFSNEIDRSFSGAAIAPGSLVCLVTRDGTKLGVAYYHPGSVIAARVLSLEWDLTIDAAWIEARIQNALTLRERLFSLPFYRLIHSEADGLPGVIIDRFDDVFSIQLSTQGAEHWRAHIVAALHRLCTPTSLVFRGDAKNRELEGLPLTLEVEGAPLTAPVEVHEYGTRYYADLLKGQKTGWFYDQRGNRALVAPFARGKRVLDLYSHSGGFGLAAAVMGATNVLCVDSSEFALSLAKQAATLNGVADVMRYEEVKVFPFLERLVEDKTEFFDVVIADPPAFVQSRNDKGAGLRGYRKLAKLAAQALAPSGFLFIASCSHHADLETFQNAVLGGVSSAGRSARILRTVGADMDHPVHPMLLESQYLKGILLFLE